MTPPPALRPRNPSALRRTLLAVAVIGTLSGCSTTGVPVAQVSSRSCPPEVIGDPWIAFESPLQSTDRLTVGDRGFVTTDALVDEVEVTGDVGAVRLENGEITNTSDCGRKTSTQRWLEVHAVRPGRTMITVPGTDPARPAVITLTVER